MPHHPDSILSLPFEINARIRYGLDGINEHSTRADVAARLDEVRKVEGIGPKRLAAIVQAWLEGRPYTYSVKW
jgi:hypothetical protein